MHLKLLAAVNVLVGGHYIIGMGKGDITGPIVEIPFMGYGISEQTGTGMHTRQYCRSVVIEDVDGNTVVIATAETGMVGYELKTSIVERLNVLHPDTFTTSNVLLTSTHTHSAPGGYLTPFMFALSVSGIHRDVSDRIVGGCVGAIERAYQSRRHSAIFTARGNIENVQINRSPTSYMANPEGERALYDSDTNKESFSLLFEQTGKDERPFGSFTWFGLHPTSVNYTNRLVSTDNRGFASLKLERYFGSDFIAAIPQEAEGDVSPNTDGPKCPDGTPCDARTSRCKIGTCVAFGPGETMYDSAKIIGGAMADQLKTQFKNLTRLDGVHTKAMSKFVDFSNSRFSEASNETTCTPAFGCSFAAGTIDGNPVKMKDFFQGDTKCEKKPARAFGEMLKPPSKALTLCQFPKPILINSGEIETPWNWSPSVLELQIVEIGSVLILALPFEITTMASRRLRRNIKLESVRLRKTVDHIVISPLANDYADYLTTFEEYQEQRYEAASNVFGPNSLEAVEYHFKQMLNTLAHSKGINHANLLRPPDNRNKRYSTIPDVIYDIPIHNQEDGAIITDAKENYNAGQTVSTQFYGANPRNPQSDPFMVIERFNATLQSWTFFDDDSSWDTKVHWKRTLLLYSVMTLEWNVPEDTPAGLYRIKYTGTAKRIQKLISFTSYSAQFNIIP